MITRETIMEAYLFLREKNQSVPDETLDFMKKVSLEALNKAENLPISGARISVPNDSIIEKLAKEIIPEDLYKDCSVFPTIEDRNKIARTLFIKGMKAGIELVRHEER